MKAERLLRLALILATVTLVVFALAWELWPGTRPLPDQVVADYLALVAEGNEAAALNLWQLRSADSPIAESSSDISPVVPDLASAGESSLAGAAATDAINITIHLVDTLYNYQVEPATFWTACCEPVQMADGTDAFAAQVEVAVQKHPAECGQDLDAIDLADLEDAVLTFHLADAAHDSTAYYWGLPWERWFARPRGRQAWRIVAIDGCCDPAES